MKNEDILRGILQRDEKFYWQITGSIADWKYNPFFLIFTIATLGIFLWFVKLYRQYYCYTLTSTRLIIISGILGRRVDEIELFRIVNSISQQSPIERMAGLGSIRIDSTDKTGVVYMRKIQHPHQVRDTLREAYTIARNKKGTVLLENFG